MTTFVIPERELRVEGISLDDVTFARLQLAAQNKDTMDWPHPQIERNGNGLAVTIAAYLAEDAIQSAKQWVIEAARPHEPEA